MPNLDFDPALLDASPPVAALHARPFSAIEIDAHPDAPRLWATVVALRDAVEHEWLSEAEGIDPASDGTRGDGVAEAQKAIEALIDRRPDATATDALAEVEAL